MPLFRLLVHKRPWQQCFDIAAACCNVLNIAAYCLLYLSRMGLERHAPTLGLLYLSRMGLERLAPISYVAMFLTLQQHAAVFLICQDATLPRWKSEAKAGKVSFCSSLTDTR